MHLNGDMNHLLNQGVGEGGHALLALNTRLLSGYCESCRLFWLIASFILHMLPTNGPWLLKQLSLLQMVLWGCYLKGHYPVSPVLVLLNLTQSNVYCSTCTILIHSLYYLLGGWLKMSFRSRVYCTDRHLSVFVSDSRIQGLLTWKPSKVFHQTQTGTGKNTVAELLKKYLYISIFFITWTSMASVAALLFQFIQFHTFI